MSILNQYGQPYSYSQTKYQRSASTSTQERPWMPTKLGNIDQLIPRQDRETLVGVSRGLVENWAPARAIARQIPMYSVGKAWKPSMMTDDTEVKTTAENVIRNQFCEMSDLQGHDFATVLYHLAHLLIRDGEAFYLLTEWETGFPAVQVIPCHRIGQREWGAQKIKEGAYKGLEITEGVIRNKYGSPVAYRVLGETPDLDEDISARSLKHVFDSDYPEARRGYPTLAHGLNDGRDALQAHEWERLNMLARSSRTMIEWNESGAPAIDARSLMDGDSCSPESTATTIEQKKLESGTWTYFKAGSGSKLEAVKHDTPGEVWESFQDRLVWKVCAGVPWPVSFVKGDYGRGGGTSERRDIMQARQTIEDMQTSLEKVAKNIIGYAYKKLVKLGRIPDSADWWKWSFSKPPKVTIDDGRASKAALEMWRAGVMSDEDLLTDMGKDHEEFWRDKFNKAADKEIAFEEIQKARGVTLDIRYKGMFNINEMGVEPETNNENANDSD